MDPKYKYFLIVLILLVLGGFLTINSMPETPLNIADKLGFQ